MEGSSSVPMEELIGRPPGDPVISAFLASLGPNVGSPEMKAFPALKNRPACEYQNYKSLGVSLCFEDGKLQAIHLYSQCHGYSSYNGDMPFNASMAMTGREVVEMLGEPDRKTGGGRAGPISIAYQDKGLQFNFSSRDWENSESNIESVTIHHPQIAS